VSLAWQPREEGTGGGARWWGKTIAKPKARCDDNGTEPWRKALMATLVDDAQHRIKGCT
jgi:hypothetical protein